MSTLPKIALAQLPSPPPLGSLQFFDGYYPALEAGSYTLTVTHTVSGNSSPPAPFVAGQQVVVQAPQFMIDVTILETVYPAPGAQDIFADRLPFVVLADPSLPWERGLAPGQPAPNPEQSAPWMAIAVFAEGEVYLQNQSNSPVLSSTVSDLLAPSNTVFKPQIPKDPISSAVLNSQCQTIVISGAAFKSVLPSPADLIYLAHCRGVNTADEGEVLHSVLLGNRMPQAAASPAAPVRYFAHVLSLEGFADYLGPAGKDLPKKPDGTPQDVQLVSLYNWSFTSLPAVGQSFDALVQGVIASQQSGSTQNATAALQLPVPPDSTAPAEVLARLNQGFVALPFVSGSGEDTFAWYRGPLTAGVPQPLPDAGQPPTPVTQAGTADALMIYLAEQGLFDLSYAAAWNLGRELALADATFSRAVQSLRFRAAKAVATAVQRSRQPHLARLSVPALQTHGVRKQFARLMGAGLGSNWTAALATLHQGRPLAPPTSRSSRRFAHCPAPSCKALMTASQAPAAAVSASVSDDLKSVAAWLARLRKLSPVPFSFLVPDPRMLPPESIRFFYLDTGWIDALEGGALSIALHSSADLATTKAVMPRMRQAVRAHERNQRVRSFARAALGSAIPSSVAATGVLLRSQLVSGWPAMTVTATLGGAPLNILRDETLSPNVRLVLFDGIPDLVTLAEPYGGLLFGVEEEGIYPRCVTAPQFAGSLIGNALPVAPAMRPVPPNTLGGVLDVSATASLLATAVGVAPFPAGAVVNWNGTPLSTTVKGPQALEAIVPAKLLASPGSASITVTSKSGASQPLTLIVNAALEIDTIQPSLVVAGSAAITLQVEGVGFGADAVAQWNGAALPTKVVSPNQVTATVAASLLSTPAMVTVAVATGGNTSNAVTLNIVSGEPLISQLAPAVAAAGGSGFTLVVTGSGFAEGATVLWNGSPLNTTFESDTQLRAGVPASLLVSPNTISVTVSVSGATSPPAQFTIAAANPLIGGLNPSMALAGAGGFSLAIQGVNFGSSPSVRWGPTTLQPASVSADLIMVAVPANLLASPGKVDVTVVAGGTQSAPAPFLVIGAVPVVSLLQPAEVFAGSGDFTLKVFGGFGAGSFALQMVAAPEMQTFPTVQSNSGSRHV